MASRELTKTAIKEKGIHARIADKYTLQGLAEIAAYMECSISLVRKYITQRGLPATNFNGKQGFPISITKDLLNSWRVAEYTRVMLEHKRYSDPQKPMDNA